MSTWPPVLNDLKTDMKIDLTDTRDDTRLTQVLNASIAYVVRQRAGVYNFGAEPLLPNPTDDLWLGTIRLAARWHVRRRSPDALVDLGELGSNRVPSVDPDIERLLGVGRYAGPGFA